MKSSYIKVTTIIVGAHSGPILMVHGTVVFSFPKPRPNREKNSLSYLQSCSLLLVWAWGPAQVDRYWGGGFTEGGVQSNCRENCIQSWCVTGRYLSVGNNLQCWKVPVREPCHLWPCCGGKPYFLQALGPLTPEVLSDSQVREQMLWTKSSSRAAGSGTVASRH